MSVYAIKLTNSGQKAFENCFIGGEGKKNFQHGQVAAEVKFFVQLGVVLY